MGKSDEDEIPWFSAMTTYFSYSVLILFGQMRDFFGSLTGASRYNKVPEPVSTLCLPACRLSVSCRSNTVCDDKAIRST